jgi:hypothetical protein
MLTSEAKVFFKFVKTEHKNASCYFTVAPKANASVMRPLMLYYLTLLT